MRHLDPSLLNAEADRLEREADHQTDQFQAGVLRFRANGVRAAASEVRREQEVG